MSGKTENQDMRDMFAGMALHGILSGGNTRWPAATAAKSAYEYADAMLAERDKG